MPPLNMDARWFASRGLHHGEVWGLIITRDAELKKDGIAECALAAHLS
jgi:hypothetical protein